jgi:MFS family permease
MALAPTIRPPRVAFRPAMSNRIIVPLIIACALFMENMDATVITTALPAIAADLGVDPISLKLALTAYLLSLAVFIPISGWMADRFGALTIFRAAIVVFTLGSAACGFAQGLGDLVAYRIVQGLGGAMMVPVGRLVILRTVPKHELVQALTWLIIPALLGPMFGPPLGGFITTYFHWRWIFWINIPIGILGLLLATRYIENFREKNPPPLDKLGFVLSGIGLTGLAFGFTIFGQSLLPPVAAVPLLLVGAGFTYAFVRHARGLKNPLMNLKLLKVHTFRASVIGGFLFRIGIGATAFLLPLFFQIGFGLSPFESGMLTFWGAAGAMILRPTVPFILRRLRFPARHPVQRPDCQLLYRDARLLHCRDATHRHCRGHSCRRLFPGAAVLQRQFARLRRSRQQADESGDQHHQRCAAVGDCGGCRGGGAPSRHHAPCARRPCAHRRGFRACVRLCRNCSDVLGILLLSDCRKTRALPLPRAKELAVTAASPMRRAKNGPESPVAST